MQHIKMNATHRDGSGTGRARRLRAEGHVPAVLYGRAAGAQSLTVSPKALRDVLASEFGRNNVIDLALDGSGEQTVLLSDFQYHPITREILHADFLRIDVSQPVDVEVPFELTGKPKGVVLGGVLRQIFRKLPVRCLPAKIPVKIQHDITELGLDEHVHVEHLTLPEGVSVRLAPARTIAAVVTEKVRPEEEEAAAAAPAAAAPGAPAAEGAAPAAETKT
jgi:large subunit ribosomal protein L25